MTVRYLTVTPRVTARHLTATPGVTAGYLAVTLPIISPGGCRYMKHRLLNTCFQGGWKRGGREISDDHPAGDREIPTATSRVTA